MSFIQRTRVHVFLTVPDVTEVGVFCRHCSALDRIHSRRYIGSTKVFHRSFFDNNILTGWMQIYEGMSVSQRPTDVLSSFSMSCLYLRFYSPKHRHYSFQASRRRISIHKTDCRVLGNINGRQCHAWYPMKRKYCGILTDCSVTHHIGLWTEQIWHLSWVTWKCVCMSMVIWM